MKRTGLTYQNFFPRLISEVPEFQPIYEEHINEHDELLPHVLMGALRRYVVDMFRKSLGNESNARHLRQVVAKIFSFLESAMASSDAKLRDLVSVSFLENLDATDKVYEKIKALFGPHLKEEIEKYEQL